jgi:hypothetical protein
MSAATDELIARLAAAERRLAEHAEGPVPAALTDPDPSGTERWEAGQVWAHLAEFPRYWLGEIDRIVDVHDANSTQRADFGRTTSDPGRLEAIERDRRTDPAALLARVRDAVGAATDRLRALPDEAWTIEGTHAVRGPMSLHAIVERFIVAHLEEHADQLDLLADRG